MTSQHTFLPDEVMGVSEFTPSPATTIEIVNGRVLGPEDLPKPLELFPETELANADRLRYYFGDRIRYCHPWKAWLVWVGTHWQQDDSGEVNRMAEMVVRSILLEATVEHDSVSSKKKAAWYFKSAERRRMDNLINIATHKLPISPKLLDSQPFLLNCKNGTLDLRHGELVPHTPEHYLTRCLDIEFDPEAECPMWRAFLHSIMDSNEEMVKYLQRIVGYALTGDVREQVMFILHGAGANGKSVFLETLGAMLGEYAQTAPPEMLMQKKNRGVPNDIARMRGARMVSAIETEEDCLLSEQTVKSLTGAEIVTARFLNKEFFEFYPSHKIFLATNHLPKVKGNDHAIWRRLPRIPFPVRYWNPDKGESGPPELQMDKTLDTKLLTELPGILTWAVSGCLLWLNGGIDWPAEVRGATDAYRSEQDVMGAFIEEECAPDPEAATTLKLLYLRYTQWCGDAGEKPQRKIDFRRKMEERGFASDRGTANKPIQRGISLVFHGPDGGQTTFDDYPNP